MRGTAKTLVVLVHLVGGTSAVHAQSGDAGGPLPEPPARPLTPKALVGKSIQDLARGSIGDAMKDDVKALRRGPLLIHGNYCGVGNRPGAPPVDALDAACMRHDACTKTDKLPACACDDRLRLEATDIVQDPQTRADIRALAIATASAMAVLVCKSGPLVTLPELAVPAGAPPVAPDR